MTTKQFIEMLKEADPKGNAHIRMDGGIPRFAQLKPGYYDGPYTYFDEDGNYVLSNENDKVDIYCEDLYSFVIDKIDDNIDKDIMWEKIKSSFKFKLNTNNIERQKKEIFESIYKPAKEYLDEWYSYIEETNKKDDQL